MPTSEEIYSELHQLALQYLRGKLDTAKAEQQAAEAEGRHPDPAFQFGLQTTGIPDEVFAWLVEFESKIIRPMIVLNREAILHAVAEYLRSRDIEGAD